MSNRNLMLILGGLLGLCVCGLCVAGLAAYVLGDSITAALAPTPTRVTLPTLFPVPTIAPPIPTSTPAPTPTNTPVVPIATLGLRTPPPVSGATATPSSSGTQVVFTDNFASSCNLTVGNNDDREFKCENGEYTMMLKKSGARWTYYTEEYDNFVLEADGHVISGPPAFEYGVVFRLAEDGKALYGFTVTRDGKYSVFRYQGDKFSDVVKYTSASAIKSGVGSNRLKVIAQGSQLAFYVNDTWLTTVNDGSFAKGYFGLFVNSSDPNAKVAFDNVTLSKINRPIAVPTPK